MVEDSGRKLLTGEHEDALILSTLWEALFFAPTSNLRNRADDLLAENANVAQSIDVDRVLARARQTNNEQYLRYN